MPHAEFIRRLSRGAPVKEERYRLYASKFLPTLVTALHEDFRIRSLGNPDDWTFPESESDEVTRNGGEFRLYGRFVGRNGDVQMEIGDPAMEYDGRWYLLMLCSEAEQRRLVGETAEDFCKRFEGEVAT